MNLLKENIVNRVVGPLMSNIYVTQCQIITREYIVLTTVPRKLNITYFHTTFAFEHIYLKLNSVINNVSSQKLKPANNCHNPEH